jgi:hypothetical protein
MKFDTAIAAREAFRRVERSGELGKHLDRAIEAEERFSSSTGEDSTAAYETLLEIGESNPQARAFLEFLIYTTWNYIIEFPAPVRFEKGLELSDRYLRQTGVPSDGTPIRQIRELRRSFMNGLGLGDTEEVQEHEEDAFQGGD